MSGISQIIHDSFADAKTILLLTCHPRTKNKKSEYYHFFNKVHQLPYCDTGRSFVKGYRDCYRYLKAVQKCEISPKSIVFCCEMNYLVHILLWKSIRKKYAKKDVLLVSCNPYVDIKNGSVLNKKATALMNLYSLPLARIPVRLYMDRETKFNLGRRLTNLQDVSIFIEHAADSNGCVAFNNLPFPAEFLNPTCFENSKIQVENNTVLLLLDSTVSEYGFCEESHYLDTANNLAKLIVHNNPQCPLYIKLHPESSDSYLDKIQVPAKVIDKNYSAEEIYLANKTKIKAVYSTASTAILTASWLGIRGFNCSELFKYKPSLLKVFNKYMSSGKNVTNISGYEDVKPIEVEVNLYPDDMDGKLCWTELISELVDMVQQN